jgi:micrococcal nuclease
LTRRRLRSHPLVPFLAAALLLGAAAGQARASRYTTVFINGVPSPVFFNDGDSYRVFGGEFRGTQCRLAGFNTLESFGPVHRWGDWHPYELFVNAKQATLNARRGVWHCTTEGDRDTYGRLLLDCPDLAVDQIRRGLAHAMQIDDTPSRPEYLRAQQEAIREGRGMWAHGVPDYVMTSTHSRDEDLGREWHYNRLVSTRDGHSESQRHRETYGECEWVCNDEIRVDLPRVTAAARRLREDPTLARALAETEFFNLHLIEFVSRYRRLGTLPEYLEGELRAQIEERLGRENDAGALGDTYTEADASCMLYVDFRRRYGRERAACLRGHGSWRRGGEGR